MHFNIFGRIANFRHAAAQNENRASLHQSWNIRVRKKKGGRSVARKGYFIDCEEQYLLDIDEDLCFVFDKYILYSVSRRGFKDRAGKMKSKSRSADSTKKRNLRDHQKKKKKQEEVKKKSTEQSVLRPVEGWYSQHWRFCKSDDKRDKKIVVSDRDGRRSVLLICTSLDIFDILCEKR